MQKFQDPKKLQYIQRELQNSKSFRTPAGVAGAPGKKRGESVKGDILQNSAEQTWTTDKRAIGVLTYGC